MEKITTPEKICKNLMAMFDTYAQRGFIQFDDYWVKKIITGQPVPADERTYQIYYMVASYEMLEEEMSFEKYEMYCQKLYYYCTRTAKMLLYLDAANEVVVDEHVMVYKDGQTELRTRMQFF